MKTSYSKKTEKFSITGLTSTQLGLISQALGMIRDNLEWDEDMKGYRLQYENLIALFDDEEVNALQSIVV